MEGYDVIMLAVLLGATIFGAYKGLAWQVASISAIFASYFVAVRFREPVSEMIRANPPWNVFLAMLIIYVACSLGIWLAFRMVSRVIDGMKLKEFDRQIGALFGLAKGVLLCVIITLFAVTLSEEQRRRKIVHSRSGHYIAVFLSKAETIIPAEARQVLGPYVDSLQLLDEAEESSAADWLREGRERLENLDFDFDFDSSDDSSDDSPDDSPDDSSDDWLREGMELLENFDFDFEVNSSRDGARIRLGERR